MENMERDLNRKQMMTHLARAEKMLARGINISIPEEWREAARSLDILVGGGFASTVFDLHGGSAAYAIWVRIVARRRVALTDCKLVAGWDDYIGLIDERQLGWRLGHRDFSGDQVLNPRIMNTLKFHNCDDMVEGMILATGRPMPETYKHGMTVPFTLVFSDQNENEIRQDGGLFVDRTWKPKHKFVRQENSLRAPGGAPASSTVNIYGSRVTAVSDAERLKSWAASRGPVSKGEAEARAALQKAVQQVITMGI